MSGPDSRLEWDLGIVVVIGSIFMESRHANFAGIYDAFSASAPAVFSASKCKLFSCSDIYDASSACLVENIAVCCASRTSDLLIRASYASQSIHA